MRVSPRLRLLLAVIVLALTACDAQPAQPGPVPTVNPIFASTVTPLPTLPPTVTLAPSPTNMPTSTRAIPPTPTAPPTATPNHTMLALPKGPYLHLDSLPQQTIYNDYSIGCGEDASEGGLYSGSISGTITPYDGVTGDFFTQMEGMTAKAKATIEIFGPGDPETRFHAMVEANEYGNYSINCLATARYEIVIRGSFRPARSSSWIDYDNQNAFQGKGDNREIYQVVQVEAPNSTYFDWYVAFY